MFVYETKTVKNGVECEALAIAFEANAPVDTPDVLVFRDDTKVYAKIGDNEISGNIQ